MVVSKSKYSMCQLVINKNNLHMDQSFSSMETSDSEQNHSDVESSSSEELDSEQSHDNIERSSSERSDGEQSRDNVSSSSPEPQSRQISSFHNDMLKLRLAAHKCYSMIDQQRRMLNGFHELAEENESLKIQLKLIHLENQMWKLDIERERWMRLNAIRNAYSQQLRRRSLISETRRNSV